MKNVQVIKLEWVVLKKIRSRDTAGFGRDRAKGRADLEMKVSAEENAVNCLHMWKERKRRKAGGVHTGMLPDGELHRESVQNRSAFRRDWNSAEMSSKLPGPAGATSGSGGAQGWLCWAPSWGGHLSLGTMSQQMSLQLLEGISIYSHLQIPGCSTKGWILRSQGGFCTGKRCFKVLLELFQFQASTSREKGIGLGQSKLHLMVSLLKALKEKKLLVKKGNVTQSV